MLNPFGSPAAWNPLTKSVVLIACLTLVVSVVNLTRPSPIRFDPQLWQAEPSEEQRFQMADDLIARSRVRGKTRDEVLLMLGQPDGGGFFRDWDLVYHLGMERNSLGIDSDWLVVRFDDEDRVADYRIVPD